MGEKVETSNKAQRKWIHLLFYYLNKKVITLVYFIILFYACMF